MNTNSIDPKELFLPLAGVLFSRGARATLDCRMHRQQDTSRTDRRPMKELRFIAPLFAAHRTHNNRRIVVGIGTAYEDWRGDLALRGINLLSVSAEGLASNIEGVADTICKHLFHVDTEELYMMVSRRMSLAAIEAFTGVPTPELSRIIGRFYGKQYSQLRQESA